MRLSHYVEFRRHSRSRHKSSAPFFSLSRSVVRRLLIDESSYVKCRSQGQEKSSNSTSTTTCNLKGFFCCFQPNEMMDEETSGCCCFTLERFGGEKSFHKVQLSLSVWKKVVFSSDKCVVYSVTQLLYMQLFSFWFIAKNSYKYFSVFSVACFFFIFEDLIFL